jgi:hypothetical protein
MFFSPKPDIIIDDRGPFRRRRDRRPHLYLAPETRRHPRRDEILLAGIGLLTLGVAIALIWAGS